MILLQDCLSCKLRNHFQFVLFCCFFFPLYSFFSDAVKQLSSTEANSRILNQPAVRQRSLLTKAQKHGGFCLFVLAVVVSQLHAFSFAFFFTAESFYSFIFDPPPELQGLH